MAQGWEEIDHIADWALRVWADDLTGLFEAAALGMLSLIGGQAQPNQNQAPLHNVSLVAPDNETLLVDWLTEILRLIEEDNAFLAEVTVNRVEHFELNATLASWQGSDFSKHIKAVTYHNLTIQKTSAGLETTIVFDV